MLSITIITKNEERNIRRCLDSIQWAEEVVIVDSGSTDQTLAICKSYNCRIIHTEWLGFGKTKQLAVNETTHDWVLSIDADEVITPELQSAIQSVLKNPKADGYQIKRESFYLKRKIKYSGWQNDYPLRLFNKRKGQFNDAPVH
ncbi:MAG: glycosyltransferase family 2 protein, partial [Candidatus Marinimicrobia bacterium]|nr:glycosyltransferase family 2 protein [Candidatus Neomarinimicrobiota bacterium]MBT5267943.1 glycosyltransferase family 2 protein [Candidatus Neomarinimicrobiota bacterium]